MNIEALNSALDQIRQQFGLTEAECVLILGSGWSTVVDAFEAAATMDYADIEAMGSPEVAGHGGRLSLCRAGNKNILIFQGRRHWYEGVGWTPVALPIYVARKLNVQTALLTNASGGINEDLQPGDLMIIRDHINTMGVNPLIGPHQEIWGARFPDQTNVYPQALRKKLHDAAKAEEITIREGIYLATSGPTYETPAEIRNYHTMGADVIGMSTVPEAILASAAGMQVAGISCISNLAARISGKTLEHADVLEATQRALPLMTKLISRFVTDVCSDTI